jgi:hypothetical protein
MLYVPVPVRFGHSYRSSCYGARWLQEVAAAVGAAGALVVDYVVTLVGQTHPAAFFNRN